MKVTCKKTFRTFKGRRFSPKSLVYTVKLCQMYKQESAI